MTGLTRREWMRLTLGAAAGASLGGWSSSLRAQDGTGPTLVVVMLRGGLDGLSVLIPHRDPDYARVRRSTRIARPGEVGGALALTDELGLHPSLEPLLPAYREGRLALVPGFGSPAETRSHFEAQRLMEEGRLRSTRRSDGFLNRALSDVPRPQEDVAAVAFSPSLPLLLRGEVPVAALGTLPGQGDPTGRARQFMADILAPLYASGEGAVLDAGRRNLELMEQFGATLSHPVDSGYPPGPVSTALARTAQLIRARSGVPLFYTDVGGWDTHALQGGHDGSLARNLRKLAGALAAFEADLGAARRDVVTVCFTEFGRTVQENGSGGTDHGHGSVALVLGQPVTGGRVVGALPSLASGALFEGRDLPVTVDFRDLFAEVLARHLGVPLDAPVFPDFQMDASRFPGLVGRG